jgi:hypothetical protein
MTNKLLALRDFAKQPKCMIPFPIVFSQTLRETTDMHF